MMRFEIEMKSGLYMLLCGSMEQNIFIQNFLKKLMIQMKEKFIGLKKKRSFKDGYNATIGGDGKRYIDYDLVINTYKKLLNQNETAKILNISPDSVHNILKENNIEIKSGAEISKEKNSMSVFMIDKKDNSIIRGFPSMADAARYLIDNQLTNCKMTTIRYHISEVCNGKRKTAAGYKWSFQ